MSVITTSSFAADVGPLKVQWFGNKYKQIPKMYDKMFEVAQGDEKSYQVDALVSSFGLLQQKDEDASITYDTSKQAYLPRYQFIVYSLGFRITMEMMKDGEAFKNAKEFTEVLAVNAARTKEVLGANIYNRAFNSSYTMPGGDGKELISNAHPTAGATQSNLITGGSVDISEAGLEQIVIDISQALDNRGNKIMLQAKRLLVHPNDRPTADRILSSPLRSGTTDNDMNYLKSSGLIPEVMANNYFTDTDAWFVTTDCPRGLRWLERQEATVDDSNDFETKSNKISVLMRNAQGWSDYRGVYGSAGA